MSLPRLAVLDMAGTTVAVTDVVPAVMQAAFARFGVQLTTRAIAEVRGRSKRESIHVLLQQSAPALYDAILADRIHFTFQQLLHERLTAGVRAVPGAEAAITRLRALVGRVVLITGFDRTTTNAILEVLHWGGALVDGVVSADDVKAGRPAPDLIERAMQLTGILNPADVLVAGDTSADLLAAANARAGWIVGVLSGAHTRAELETCPHSVILPSIAELVDWLEMRIEPLAGGSEIG
jgi:phosphonatase-like hydrolase